MATTRVEKPAAVRTPLASGSPNGPMFRNRNWLLFSAVPPNLLVSEAPTRPLAEPEGLSELPQPAIHGSMLALAPYKNVLSRLRRRMLGGKAGGNDMANIQIEQHQPMIPVILNFGSEAVFSVTIHQFVTVPDYLVSN